MGNIGYNERAWAIDVISAINLACAHRYPHISRAGGEESLAIRKSRTLFPDVTLYADRNATLVRHGWELKMPDTPIDDPALVANATEKARSLNTDSFLLWNVTDAALYVRKDDGFVIHKQWPSLSITTRADVKRKENIWRARLNEILADIDVMFEKGEVVGRSLDKEFTSDLLAHLIEIYTGPAADEIRRAAGRSRKIENGINTWWFADSEFSEADAPEVDYLWLARQTVTCWMARFLFSHTMKAVTPVADAIDHVATPEEALRIFEDIQTHTHRIPLFNNGVADTLIGEETWDGLLQLNTFLSSLKFQNIDQAIIADIQKGSADMAARRSRGQYGTPDRLAEFLVRLAVEERHEDVLDPCSGSGAIARATVDCKLEWGMDPASAAATTWAFDKHESQVWLSRMAMSSATTPYVEGRIARRDVFDIATLPGSAIAPGSRPRSIVSNLPFVRADRIAPEVKEHLDARFPDRPGRADLYAYILMHLAECLDEKGSLGVILSNAWSASQSGRELIAALERRGLYLNVVVRSGAGRWFRESDITTHLVIFTRTPEAPVTFATTMRDIHDLASADIARITRKILVGHRDRTGEVDLHAYDRQTFMDLLDLGLSPSAMFADLSWLGRMEPFTTPSARILDINRGERWGSNEFFYPRDSTSIEREYLRPVVRSSKSITGFDACPDGCAFVCTDSEAELESRSAQGALAHIRRFAEHRNNKGIPLSRVLRKKTDLPWYAAPEHGSAEFVISINPDRRLFVARMAQRCIVDQRLIRIERSGGHDPDLVHALLNSSFCLFQYEALGFPRALGALDLTPTTLCNSLRLPDPDLLDAAQTRSITEAFERLKARGVRDLEQDLADHTRRAFEHTVAKAFGFEDILPAILSSLQNFYAARKNTSRNS